jgi:hypothetical protein
MSKPDFPGDPVNKNLTKAKANERLRKYVSYLVAGKPSNNAYCDAYGYDINDVDIKKVEAQVSRLDKLAYVQEQLKQAAAMVETATLERYGIKAGEMLKELRNIALNGLKDSDRIAAIKAILSAIGADAPKQNKSTHLTVNVVNFGTNTSPIDGSSCIGRTRGERYSTLQIPAETIPNSILASIAVGEEASRPSESPKVG